MRDPNALVSTDQLAAMLGDPNLRLFDCTTHLNPPPPGSDGPYTALPGFETFAAAHVPGANFLDLQGEFPAVDAGRGIERQHQLHRDGRILRLCRRAEQCQRQEARPQGA